MNWHLVWDKTRRQVISIHETAQEANSHLRRHLAKSGSQAGTYNLIVVTVPR